jgi:hypothetical protein
MRGFIFFTITAIVLLCKKDNINHFGRALTLPTLLQEHPAGKE